jgi:hypothetical protein
MSLSSRSLAPVAASRFGSLGIFSVGVIAFALTALQGCASPMVTASSLKEPSGPSTVVVGQLRPDAPTHVEPRAVSASRVAERPEPRSHESRGSRHDSCRRCSN